MKILKKISFFILLIIIFSAFKLKVDKLSTLGGDGLISAYETEFSTNFIIESSTSLENLSDSFYTSIFKNGNALNKKVFKYALKGYSLLLKQGLLLKKDTITVIDYSLSANIKRLWVLDLKNKTILFHELVAHGRNSGNEFAKTFSNTTNSLKTSLGFFLTGEIYKGAHDKSIKLHGIENKFNSNAFERGIVIHGAKYVSEEFIDQNQRLGRSQGCPAVSEVVISEISKVISNGSCLFAYYPNKAYLKGSKFLKGS